MTPEGLPAWTRTAAHGQYGGDINKTNYLSQGVIDPTTDVGAEEITRIAADLEALARTAPFAVITYLCRDTGGGGGPAAPTVETVFMMTGVRLTSYFGDAAPSGFPSAARNGNDDVTFTFASSYTDPYSVVGSFAVKHAIANAHGSGTRIANVETTATTVRVRGFTDAGVAGTDNRFTLTVW